MTLGTSFLNKASAIIITLCFVFWHFQKSQTNLNDGYITDDISDCSINIVFEFKLSCVVSPSVKWDCWTCCVLI